MHRARVAEDFAGEGIRVQIAHSHGGGTVLRNFAGGSDYQVTEGQLAPDDSVYSLFMRPDEARALWEELCRYYGGNPPTVTDRADLMAERARVDKLTDAVIAIATRP